ncbi:MAG: monovalent cation/H+ antiporter complex subunit F [Bdellovibrionota bacterium]
MLREVFFQSMALIIGLSMLLSLVRVIQGPTSFDRLTGSALIGTKTIVLIILLGIIKDQVSLYVDIALTYAIIGFIGSLIFAKFFEHQPEERS